jgi:hypothetical protein
MIQQYGEKKGREVYFASQVKGKPGASKWEGRGGTGKLVKAKATYAREHKGAIMKKLAERKKKKTKA